jgi:ribonuclease-3
MTDDTIIPESDLERVRECEADLRYRFRDPRILLQALTHSSIKSDDTPSNERLEFLGDSVLGLVMTEFLFNFFQGHDEGELTQIKSFVVSTNTLANESERLNLHRHFNVGKGVTRRQQMPRSLLANVFEAVVAAIYRDSGLEPARRFVLGNLYHQVLTVAQNRHDRNFKSILQQYAQKEINVTPTYRVLSERGPDHQKWFEVEAMLDQRPCRSGSGSSKKEAEQSAARASLKMLLEERATESDLALLRELGLS